MNLDLPIFTDQADTTVSPQPRKFKRWLSELPMVNMGEATRLFYQTIQAFNRQPIPAKARLELMEQMRPVAHQAVEYLNKHFLSCAFPLTGKNRQIEQLEQALLQEMSIGYKLVVNEVDAHNSKLDKKSLLIATHRGMRYLEKSLQLSARLYTNPAATIWRDLHQLYEYAEQQKMTDLPVDDEEYLVIKESSIADVYKQNCLLALSEPNHLKNGAVTKLVRVFETASEYCEITKTLNPDNSGSLYITSLKSSEPPAYVTLAELTSFNNLRGIGLSKLIGLAKSSLDSTTGQASFFKDLDTSLLQEILTTWTTHKKRHFNRAPANTRIIVATGIRNIVQAISKDYYPELSPENLLKKQTIKSAGNSATTPMENTTWNKLMTHSSLYSREVLDTTEPKAPPLAPRLPESWQHWKLLNSSSGGYGLLWDNPSSSRAQVGEIVALREKENHQYQWRLGQIRWMKHTSQGALSLGVQLISPRAIIAEVEDIPTRAYSALPGQIIMLPGMKSRQQAPSILVPEKNLQVGDELVLSLFGKQVCVKLTSTGEQPSFFTQFFYQSIERSENRKDTDNFGKLWDKL